MTRYIGCSGPSGGPCPRMKQYEAECRRRDPGGHSDGIYNPRPVRGGHTWSLHACGRALDWAPSTKEAGDAIAAWLTGPAAPDDMQGLIWQRRQWGFTHGKLWLPYHGVDPHTSHLHIESNVCRNL